MGYNYIARCHFILFLRSTPALGKGPGAALVDRMTHAHSREAALIRLFSVPLGARGYQQYSFETLTWTNVYASHPGS